MSTTTLEPASIAPNHDEPNSIDSHAGASFFCTQLALRGFSAIPSPRILVAGCGAGHEAIALQDRLDAEVEAVDVEDFVHERYRSARRTHFQVASVCDLPFEDRSFDAVFYHHVIEHVDRPQESIHELTRVLKNGGWLFIGTPNRQRLISSIGAHEQSEWEATFWNKFKDNVRDWKDRFTGRFHNQYGAHAGFSRFELDDMLAPYYSERVWLTEDYLRFKYGKNRMASLLPIATSPAICWFAAPSIYVLCRK